MCFKKETDFRKDFDVGKSFVASYDLDVQVIPQKVYYSQSFQMIEILSCMEQNWPLSFFLRQ